MSHRQGIGLRQAGRRDNTFFRANGTGRAARSEAVIKITQTRGIPITRLSWGGAGEVFHLTLNGRIDVNVATHDKPAAGLASLKGKYQAGGDVHYFSAGWVKRE
jgi:hypothetical protein